MAVKFIDFKQHTLNISYEIVNPQESIDIIILHGWGSNKEIMKKSFSTYMNGFRHIYVDLPGFGNSTCNLELSTEDYARIIELFMVQVNAQKDIILGHSFGGKVALLLDPKVLVLISSAGVYVPKSIKTIFKIFSFKVLKIFKSSKIHSFFVSDDAKELNEHMYQTFKKVVDENFEREFQKYNGKALLFWGKDDKATPLGSAKKIHSLLVDSFLDVYEGDHYFFTKNSKDISQKIQNSFLDTLGK